MSVLGLASSLGLEMALQLEHRLCYFEIRIRNNNAGSTITAILIYRLIKFVHILHISTTSKGALKWTGKCRT